MPSSEPAFPQRRGIKTLAPKQMLQKVPTLLSQGQVGNASENLLN